MAHGDRLDEALRLLQEQLRAAARGHPLGHLLPGRGEAIDLKLTLPLDPGEEQRDAARERLQRALDEGLAALLLHRASFVPGRVYCLRCRQAACGHAAPSSARQVFGGYTPSGVPRFVDFGQWLLEREDPRVESLYGDAGPLVTRRSDEAELCERLLPAFRDRRGVYRLHGQVAAGWYRVPSEGGRPDPFAVTLQVVSSRAAGGRRRFGLNVIGVGPAGQDLERLRPRLGAMPWSAAVRWAQTVLDQVGRQYKTRQRGAAVKLARRLDGLLAGLSRRLEQRQRSTSRRTQHAERRHREGSRPTRMALADLERAPSERLFYDTREHTLVVVGERGRTHVFSRQGKLVTSIRYPPGSIDRKVGLGRWKAASPEQIDALRSRLGAD